MPDSSTVTFAVQDEHVDADVEFLDFEDMAPQVVIHSGESDSDSTGFAALNPVINGRHHGCVGRGSSNLNSLSSKKYRTTVPLANPVAGSDDKGFAQFPSTKPSSSRMQPLLQEIPMAVPGNDQQPHAGVHPFLLIINALGASGLSKVEKFGTQSSFIEMLVVQRPSVKDTDEDEGTKLSSLRPSSFFTSSILRTTLHKKGSSETQWNQQFTTPLPQSGKETHILHVCVKTNNKVVVGEAEIPLINVGDLFYDQYCTIYRRDGIDSLGNSTSNVNEVNVSGQVHLQLKIVDAALVVVAPVAIPLLALSHVSSSKMPQRKQDLHTATIPPVLFNGALLYKVPYHNNRGVGNAVPRRQWVAVIRSETTSSLEITWCDPTASSKDKKSLRSLDLALVTEVREDHGTKAFERQAQLSSSSSVVQSKERCFSLVSPARALDLVASCKEEARIWISALRELLFHESSDANSCSESARIMNDYRNSALPPRSSTTTLCPSQEDTAVKCARTTNSSNNKAKLVTWRSNVFNLARRNHIDEIAGYLHDGCPIDLLEPGDGDTILMIACHLGHVQLVELCLSWRAKNDPHPEFGETALQVAVNASNAKCVELLLSTAAKSDMDAEIVNHIDSKSDAPLHVAARHGDLACLQLLLHHGANICVVEEFGRTPLHCAVAQGHLDCVAYLLDVGGDSVLNTGDHDGDTALHYAALAGNEAIVKLLLESAANVFSVNIQNETPYDIALREKQQPCAFLISQYYLTNTKEPPTSSPATRNKTASALLLQQRKQQREYDDVEDEHEDEHYDGSDSDTSTAYASHSPQHSLYNERARTIVAAKYGVDFEDDDRYFGSSSESQHVVASPRMLSPSDQVREALLRQDAQRHWREIAQAPRYERSYHHRYYSARKHERTHAPLASGSRYPRAAFTERLERDNYYSYARSPQHQGGAHHDGLRYHEATRYPSFYHEPDEQLRYQQSYYGDRQQPGRNRSHSDQLRYGSTAANEDEWTRHEAHSWSPQYHHARRSNSMDTSVLPSRGYHSTPLPVRSGWTSDATEATYELVATLSKQESQQSYRLPSEAATTASMWDTFYTQEGYAYYVHRATGVSQWEPPSAVEAAPPLASSSMQVSQVVVQETKLQDTMPPDSIIRMRLAEARRQKSMPHLTPSPSTPTPPTPSLEAAAASMISMQDLQQGASSVDLIPRGEDAKADTTPPCDTGLHDGNDLNATLSAPSLPVPVAAELPSSRAAAASAPAASKFEARTGFKLSVDVSSPTRVDDSLSLSVFVLCVEIRPVFVPSPRGKSPRQHKESEYIESSPTKQLEAIFQKSRPSSPRGKSKNIQLIDLKRANNLAIALVNFKINSNYEQIVHDIVCLNEKVVHAELLACLQRFFPTEDERRMLQSYDGPIVKLGKAEQFLCEMMRVPDMHERIDMFLYKLEFPRNQRGLLSKIQIVKRACRDLLENCSFLQALEKVTKTAFASTDCEIYADILTVSCMLVQFYGSYTLKSFQVFLDHKAVFKSDYLSKVDEKLRSFHVDLLKAVPIESLDLQIQWNRMLSGMRPIHAFVEKHQDVQAHVLNERDLVAHGVLQLFIVETRGAMAEIEKEYESMGALGDKLLSAFGESKASNCPLSTICKLSWTSSSA
ncbi:Cortactin-binding protein 2, partial [Globisporangium splendens]